jgi:hypothetical protein
MRFSMDLLHSKISLRRPLPSYSKVKYLRAALYPFIYALRNRFAQVPRVPGLHGCAKNLYKKNGYFFCDYLSGDRPRGLSSEVSIALEDIITLYRVRINVVRIDYSAGMSLFKDEKDKDVYEEFFQRPGPGVLKLPRRLRFKAGDVHEPYKQLPLSELCRAASILFSPSRAVIQLATEMVMSSGISPDRSIAICYRGTDKSREVKLAPVGEYIQVANDILQKSAADLEIIVQTDQEQVRDTILAHFGQRCRFFNDLPVTRGSTAIHDLKFGQEIMMRREDFAKRMIAATVVLSRCAYVITSTGNVGAWIAIYRGTPSNLYQFDKNGELQAP